MLFGLSPGLANSPDNVFEQKILVANRTGFEEGAIIGAQAGTRHGREAVFQLIERPFPATFAFVRGKRPGRVHSPLDLRW